MIKHELPLLQPFELYNNSDVGIAHQDNGNLYLFSIVWSSLGVLSSYYLMFPWLAEP